MAGVQSPQGTTLLEDGGSDESTRHLFFLSSLDVMVMYLIFLAAVSFLSGTIYMGPTIVFTLTCLLTIVMKCRVSAEIEDKIVGFTALLYSVLIPTMDHPAGSTVNHFWPLPFLWALTGFRFSTLLCMSLVAGIFHILHVAVYHVYHSGSNGGVIALAASTDSLLFIVNSVIGIVIYTAFAILGEVGWKLRARPNESLDSLAFLASLEVEVFAQYPLALFLFRGPLFSDEQHLLLLLRLSQHVDTRDVLLRLLRLTVKESDILIQRGASHIAPIEPPIEWPKPEETEKRGQAAVEQSSTDDFPDIRAFLRGGVGQICIECHPNESLSSRLLQIREFPCNRQQIEAALLSFELHQRKRRRQGIVSPRIGLRDCYQIGFWESVDQRQRHHMPTDIEDIFGRPLLREGPLGEEGALGVPSRAAIPQVVAQAKRHMRRSTVAISGGEMEKIASLVKETRSPSIGLSDRQRRFARFYSGVGRVPPGRLRQTREEANECAVIRLTKLASEAKGAAQRRRPGPRLLSELVLSRDRARTPLSAIFSRPVGRSGWISKDCPAFSQVTSHFTETGLGRSAALLFTTGYWGKPTSATAAPKAKRQQQPRHREPLQRRSTTSREIRGRLLGAVPGTSPTRSPQAATGPRPGSHRGKVLQKIKGTEVHPTGFLESPYRPMKRKRLKPRKRHDSGHPTEDSVGTAGTDNATRWSCEAVHLSHLNSITKIEASDDSQASLQIVAPSGPWPPLDPSIPSEDIERRLYPSVEGVKIQSMFCRSDSKVLSGPLTTPDFSKLAAAVGRPKRVGSKQDVPQKKLQSKDDASVLVVIDKKPLKRGRQPMRGQPATSSMYRPSWWQRFLEQRQAFWSFSIASPTEMVTHAPPAYLYGAFKDVKVERWFLAWSSHIEACILVRLRFVHAFLLALEVVLACAINLASLTVMLSSKTSNGLSFAEFSFLIADVLSILAQFGLVLYVLSRNRSSLPHHSAAHIFKLRNMMVAFTTAAFAITNFFISPTAVLRSYDSILVNAAVVTVRSMKEVNMAVAILAFPLLTFLSESLVSTLVVVAAATLFVFAPLVSLLNRSWPIQGGTQTSGDHPPAGTLGFSTHAASQPASLERHYFFLLHQMIPVLVVFFVVARAIQHTLRALFSRTCFVYLLYLDALTPTMDEWVEESLAEERSESELSLREKFRTQLSAPLRRSSILIHSDTSAEIVVSEV